MQDYRGRVPRNRTNAGQGTSRDRKPFVRPNIFLSFILYLFTTLFIFSFILLLVLRSAGVSNVIQNTDILYYLEDVAVDGHDYYIVDQFNNMPFSNTELTLVDIEDFIKTDAVTNGINSIVEGYAQAFAMGNLEHHVTMDEVIGIANDLHDEISAAFDHNMTDEDIEYLVERLDDLLDFNSLTIGGLMDDFEMDMSIPLLLLSPALRWLIGSLCVFLLIAIFALRKDNIPEASFAVGIPIVLAGVAAFITGMILDSVSHTPDSFFQRFERFLEAPVTQIMQLGFAFTAAGVLIIIIAKTFTWANR